MMGVDRLKELENVIDENRRSFYVIGKALHEIRENQLYKNSFFKTFEAYAKNRWGIGKSHAYRLIEGYRVIENLSPIGDILPETESQVRPLVSLKPNEQQRIWREFLSSGMELTAANISRMVPSKSPRDPPSGQSEIISRDYKKAVFSMLDQVRIAQNDKWQSTSKQAALFWNKVIWEKISSK